MATQYTEIPFGLLNRIDLSNQIIPYSLTDSSVRHLRRVTEEVSNPSQIKSLQYYIGQVLYVIQNTELNQVADSISSVFGTSFSSNIKLTQIFVRIPELHAILPTPDSSDDIDNISVYPVFTAVDDTVPIPVEGDLVYVDFKNKVNLTDGIYIGPVKSSGQSQVGILTKDGTTATNAFREQKFGKLPTAIGEVDMAKLGNKQILPQYVQLSKSGLGFVRDTSTEYMTFGYPALIGGIEDISAKTVTEISKLTGQDPNDPNLAIRIHDLNTSDGVVPGNHKTHWNGTNVDIGYYYTLPDGKNVQNIFINSSKLPHTTVRETLKDGRSWQLRSLTSKHAAWSDEANWILVQVMLEDRRVKQILTDPIYCKILEQKALEVFGAGSEKYKRALKIIQYEGNHDNHFHLTISQ